VTPAPSRGTRAPVHSDPVGIGGEVGGTRGALLASAELDALERLGRVLRARPGRAAGRAPGRTAGRGFDLLGLEPWREGGDVRHLDVAARVRTGSWWVRTFQQEGEPRLWIGLDASASMAGVKLAAARRVAAALVVVASQGLVRVAVETLGTPPAAAVPRATRWRGPAQAAEALRRLASVRGDARFALPDALGALALAASAAAADQLVVLSDLADPAGPAAILEPLRALAAQARVDVVHLREPADARLPPGARALRSPETGEVRSIWLPEGRGALAAGDAFEAAVTAWQGALGAAAARAGVALHAANAVVLDAAPALPALAEVVRALLSPPWR
jgi:uncharacterized protein (DUF58 family)